MRSHQCNPAAEGKKPVALLPNLAGAVLRHQLLRNYNMNQEQVEGNWSQLTGKIKEKWGLLTDDDLTVAKGRREALSGRLQERYGIAKEAAETQLDEFMKASEKTAAV